MAETTYYIRLRGIKQGPLTPSQLANLAVRGQFTALHEISEDGRRWVPAVTRPELLPAGVSSFSLRATTGRSAPDPVVEAPSPEVKALSAAEFAAPPPTAADPVAVNRRPSSPTEPQVCPFGLTGLVLATVWVFGIGSVMGTALGVYSLWRMARDPWHVSGILMAVFAIVLGFIGAQLTVFDVLPDLSSVL